MSSEEHNRNLCKSIVNEIEAYCDRRMYRCPDCGEILEWSDDDYDLEESAYTCPHCGKTFDEDELDALSLYDYLNKNAYDVEYRIDASGNYKSVQIMVAGGGPNIYIDTADDRVKLFWWTERAEYSFLPDVGNAIDEYYEQEYLNMR